MNYPEINGLGYFASTLIIVGVYLLGNKNIKGWYIGIIGTILTVIYALIIRSFPIVFVDSVFTVMYGINILKWQKKVIE